MADKLIDNVTLTGTPDDNMAVLDVLNSTGMSMYVVYNQGTENDMRVLLQFSSVKDDAGAEVWCDWSDVNQVSGPDKHLIENNPFKITATGNYRIPYFPISPKEDKVRVKVYADTPGATPGTVTIYLVDDKYVNNF